MDEKINNDLKASTINFGKATVGEKRKPQAKRYRSRTTSLLNGQIYPGACEILPASSTVRENLKQVKYKFNENSQLSNNKLHHISNATSFSTSAKLNLMLDSERSSDPDHAISVDTSPLEFIYTSDSSKSGNHLFQACKEMNEKCDQTDSFTQTSKTIIQLAMTSTSVANIASNSHRNANEITEPMPHVESNEPQVLYCATNFTDSKNSIDMMHRSLKDQFLSRVSPLRRLRGCSEVLTQRQHQAFLQQKSPLRNESFLTPVVRKKRDQSEILSPSAICSRQLKRNKPVSSLNIPVELQCFHIDHQNQLEPNLNLTLAVSEVVDAPVYRRKPLKSGRRSDAFMSPTIASETKSIMRELERIDREMSPTRERIEVSSRSHGKRDEGDMMGEMGSVENDYRIGKEFPRRNTHQNAPSFITHQFDDDDNSCILHKLKPGTQDCDMASISMSESNTSTVIDHKDPLQDALIHLRDCEWSSALRGLAQLLELSRVLDYERLAPEMPVINQRLLELLRSPRSHVCRIACQAAGQLFETMKYTKRPEFDDIVDTLLCKTADANKFIRRDANVALDTMVTHIPLVHSVRAISLRSTTHKNPLVRTAAVRLLVCIVGLAGTDVIINGAVNEPARKKIMMHVAKYLTDKCVEARRYGERLYKLLSRDPNFEYCFKNSLDRDAFLQVRKVIKNLNHK